MWSGLAFGTRFPSASRWVRMQMAGEIRRKEKGSVNVQISLKALVPVIPKTPTARRKLEEDLTRIECAGLLKKLWNIKDEGMVRELVEGAPNQFDHTVRCRLEKWTAFVWRETYGFKLEGYGWASRTDNSQFSKSMNPKDGYAVSDCNDFRTKQVLEFLIPILYLEKSTRVTVTVGNTVFGVLLGDRPVDWGLLIYDVVTQMVRLVSKGKPTMVCPFIFHIYKERQVLRSTELATYTLAMEMVKYDCTPDPKPNPERAPTPSHSGSGRPRPTSTPERSRKGKTPTKRRGESSAERQDQDPEEPSAFEVDRNAQAFDNAICWVETAREYFDALEQIVKDVAEAVDLRDFDRALSTLPKPRDLADRDHRIQGLQKDKAILNARIAQKEADWA